MRGLARRLLGDLRFLVSLRVLPARVAVFQWRAWRLAGRLQDEFGRVSATRPWKLAAILEVAEGRRGVVELGTAHAWTAISLALADRRRHVVTYDQSVRPESRLYLELVPTRVRDRVTLVHGSSLDGPRHDRAVELLYIDTTHDRKDTIRELEAWRPALVDGAVVVFDDYGNPAFPGVEEAVRELKLRGDEREGLFIHRFEAGHPGRPEPVDRRGLSRARTPPR
jgi:methyltransferase family protein